MKKLIVFMVWCAYAHPPITITKKQATTIGNKIWYNECRNSVEKLTWWKKGEQWASLGIGHFIWYPNTYKGIYTQTFPELVQFLKQQKANVPSWLLNQTTCPWTSEEDFFAAFSTQQMLELRTLLANTIDLQTQFILQRLQNALPTMLAQAPKNMRTQIKKQFYRVAQTAEGIFALIDYINFKGEGTNTKERYHNQGWGLLHVLEQMHGADNNAVQEFVESAKKILTQRVNHAPAERNEQQWLQGWHNRVDRYAATKS